MQRLRRKGHQRLQRGEEILIRRSSAEEAEEGGKSPRDEAQVQLRRALVRRLLPRDQRVVGQVQRARHRNDHHQDWQVSLFSLSLVILR